MQNIDWNYLNTVVSFLIGILAGFQAIYERFPKAPVLAAFTLPGSFYLFTRGALPAGSFAALYHYDLIKSHLVLWALALGVGAEAILRSQIFIKQSSKEGGGIDELIKGPLDLLRRYQDMFLVAIGTKDAQRTLNFVKKHLPPGDFKALCTRVQDNAGAFNEPIRGLEEAVTKLIAEFDSDSSDSDPATKNERYRRKLGFKVLLLAGKENSKTLFS